MRKASPMMDGWRVVAVALALAVAAPAKSSAGDKVVILHGLARSAASMSKMEDALKEGLDKSILDLSRPSFMEPFKGSIPGPGDGKVSLKRARLDGMSDFLVLPVTHSLMMSGREAIEQTLRFLDTGRFEHPASHDDETPPSAPGPG